MAFFSKETVTPPEDSQQAQQALSLLMETASRDRRMRMQKRMDYFYDKQEQYLDRMLIDQFKYPDRLKLQKEFYNITDLIINETAITYNENPLREIQNGTETDNQIYADIVRTSSLNQVMQQVNQFTKLFKTVSVRPVWRNESIQYDIYTPNMYDVFQDKIDPSKAVAYVWGNVIDIQNEIPKNNDDTRGERDPWDERQNVFYYMDKGTFIVFSLSFTKSGQIIPQISNNLENPDNINPYGVLPFVVSRDGMSMDQYFLEGGDGLINSNDIINIKTTELNYLTKMQSFSVPVRKGADDKSGSLILDPSMTIDLPADDDVSRNADFKFVTPDSKIKEIQDYIDSKIKKVAIKNNLSPERFTTSAQKSSAESLQLRAWDQAKILKRDKAFYASFESELYEMTRIVWNYHNPQNKLSESSELFIDYKEIETPMTVQERDNHNIIMYNNGLLSKKDWLMDENPDLKDEKQAEKIIEENEKERQESVKSINIPILEEQNQDNQEIEPDNE